MIRWNRALLGTALVFCLGAPLAHAQRGGMGMMGGGGAAILAMPEVHKELKLSDEQAKKCEELATSMREGMRERFQGLQGLSQEEMRETMQKLMKEMNDEVAGKAKVILDEKQLSRFKQLEIQARGFQALMDEEVAKALKVTDEQKTKLQALAEESGNAMRSAFQEAAGDREAMQAKIAEIRKSSMDKVKELMSDDQKKAWKDMTGEPFTFPAGPRRRDA